MSTCKLCGEYYRLSPYNKTNFCDSCDSCSTEDFPLYDDDDRVEVDMLMNPTGKVQPVFYDEDESHGS